MTIEMMLIYFMMTLVIIGLLASILFKLNFGVSDMETKMTGIWSNRDNSMRVLIYHIDSQMQGEVVWTGNNNDRILGSTVIKDIHLTFFGWSKGTYIDPLTRTQFSLRMKLKRRGKLDIKLLEYTDHENSNQQWNLVNG